MVDQNPLDAHGREVCQRTGPVGLSSPRAHRSIRLGTPVQVPSKVKDTVRVLQAPFCGARR